MLGKRGRNGRREKEWEKKGNERKELRGDLFTIKTP